MKPRPPKSTEVSEGAKDAQDSTGPLERVHLDELEAMNDALAQRLAEGWAKIEADDAAAARKIAEALVAEADEAGEDAPEALTLLGAAAAAEGDGEQAIAYYESALAIDPDYFEPQLLLAETLLDASDDLDTALEHADLALDLAEDEDEVLDAMLLKAEVLVAMGEDADARELLGDLPPIALPEAEHHMRAGRLYADLEDFADAQRHFELAVKLAPDSAEAHHGLGVVADLTGRDAERKAAWRKVRELDLAAEAPRWHLSEARVRELAGEALDELPEAARARLGNVPVQVWDYPSLQQIDDGMDPRLLGVFDGVALGDQSAVGGTPSLAHIFLFQRNIERVARTEDEVQDEVRITVLHETAHFFGLGEAELEALGLD